MYRFDLVLCLLTHLFLSEVKSAPAAGAGLTGRLAVEGILKRLFSCSQQRAKGGVTGALHLLPVLVEGGCMESSLVGSYLVVVHSVESI